jgi:hypothetical protein
MRTVATAAPAVAPWLIAPNDAPLKKKLARVRSGVDFHVRSSHVTGQDHVGGDSAGDPPPRVMAAAVPAREVVARGVVEKDAPKEIARAAFAADFDLGSG